jgi:prophage regulatory protein
MTQCIHRLPAVKARTGVSRTYIYDAIGKGTFPAPVQLGPRAVGWLASDITAWIESRPTAGAVVAHVTKRGVA